MKSPRRSMVLLTVVALVTVGVLAASSIVLASNQVTQVVDQQVQTTASVSSQVLGQRTTDLVALVHSYATRRSLVIALSGGSGSDTTVEQNLRGLAEASPGISASFLADIHGVSRNTFPFFPAAIGKSFAYREWFKGLVASGRPYVSSAIKTKEASHTLAVTVTDYVRGTDGRPVGILGVNYSLASIASFAAGVGKAQGITLKVTDRTGTSLTAGGAHGLVSLATDPRVRGALAGRTGLLDFAPVLPGGSRGPLELSAYAPITGTGWTVIASKPESVAFAGLDRLRSTVLSITALLVLILLAGVGVIARSERRRRESELRIRSQERELARVLESTDEGFVSVDGAGAITGWNAQAEKIYGWAASEALGRDAMVTVFPAASRQEYTDDLAGYRAGADSRLVGKRVEMSALHRDGHEIPLEIGVWAHDHDEGFSAFVHDITERVAFQADVATARDQAIEASRLKSAFLATMSHEIRTPMSGVIGLTGLLQRTNLAETQRRYVDGIRVAGNALLSVINDILDFSKIEAGALILDDAAVDLGTVLEEVVGMVSESARVKGVELLGYCEPALVTPLRGDPVRIRQILLNLASNAVKFTEHGEVYIHIQPGGNSSSDSGNSSDGGNSSSDGTRGDWSDRGGRSDRSDSRDAAGAGAVGGTDDVGVRFEVSDTGIGILPADRARVFESFAQADSSTTRKFGGTGLGLAICRELVAAMGGEIGVDGRPDRGSLFWFALRLRRDPDGADAPKAHPFSLAGQRVLVVDDNETNRTILSEQLSDWAMVPTAVESAQEALARLRGALAEGDFYDLAIVDMQMPGLNGLELAQEIQTHFSIPPLPVVLASCGEPVEAGTARDAGIIAMLSKPIQQSMLYDCLVGVAAGSSLAARRLAQTPTPAPEPVPPTLGRVLLVEDNEINQMVAVGILTELGYGVDVASDGREALELVARDNTYRAVLMDCQMPTMDGYEATRELRRLERTAGTSETSSGSAPTARLPIIAMTAAAQKEDRERCLAAGMDDYLTKPVQADELAAALIRWTTGGVVSSSSGLTTYEDSTESSILNRLDALRDQTPDGVVLRLVSSFLVRAPGYLSELRDTLQRDDFDAFAQAAHSLNGAAGNLGARALATLCGELEDVGHDRRPHSVPDLLSRLQAEYDAVSRVLEAIAA